MHVATLKFEAMSEADEATNELIARLIAGETDQYGYEEIGTGDQSDDSDYGQPKKKRNKKGGTKAAPKVAAAPRAPKRKSGTFEADAPTEEVTASGRRKRKDTGARREGAAKGWTEEEERLFLEGLELYGREWHKAAAHVGTRDKKAFTSHAQKHFIKLCIADKPLPKKVIETGAGDGMGYTLSGLLLDPDSSSAKSYGFKSEHLERLLASNGPGVKGLLLPGKENAARKTAAPKKKEAPVPSSQGEGEGVAQRPRHSSAQKAEELPLQKKAAAPAEPSKQAGNHQRAREMAEARQEPTDYVKNRPRREGAGTKSRWGATTESLELVPCSKFYGPPGSGASQAQPFEVVVEGQAQLVMDFHAHLCGCEIIGLLGGQWEADNRRIIVKAAYPCTRLEGSHSGTSVEVAPEAQVKAMQQMEQNSHTSVGWYHSHPIFEPTPSQKDNENQRNQQALHRCGKTGLEPCLGVIIGPYDKTLPSEASIIRYFVVQSRASNLVPFDVRLSGNVSLLTLPNPSLEATLRKLIDTTASDPDRMDMTQEWRPFRLLVDGQPHGGRLLNLSKMRLAIARHLCGNGANQEEAAVFLDSIFSYLKTTWNIPASAPAQPKVEQASIAVEDPLPVEAQQPSSTGLQGSAKDCSGENANAREVVA